MLFSMQWNEVTDDSLYIYNIHKAFIKQNSSYKHNDIVQPLQAMHFKAFNSGSSIDER